MPRFQSAKISALVSGLAADRYVGGHDARHLRLRVLQDGVAELAASQGPLGGDKPTAGAQYPEAQFCFPGRQFRRQFGRQARRLTSLANWPPGSRLVVTAHAVHVPSQLDS